MSLFMTSIFSPFAESRQNIILLNIFLGIRYNLSLCCFALLVELPTFSALFAHVIKITAALSSSGVQASQYD